MSYPVTVDDTDITFDCAQDQNILDAAEQAGWAIPYSCRKGVCISCAGTLCSGSLDVRARGTITGPAESVLLCQARPTGPVRIRPKRITASAPPTRKTITTIVYRIRRPAPRVTVVDLRFPIGRRAPFQAGQFLDVLLPDGETRPYSLANSPRHNDAAQLHVRTEPGGRFSDEVVRDLRPGDLVTVELPFGEVRIEPTRTDPLVLLATGTGFAPIQSFVLDQIARRTTRPMHLYWGGRTEDDLYRLGVARYWASRYDWFRCTPVLSRAGRDWSGARGWVQQVACDDHPDLRGRQVYACGNPAMTAAALATLTARTGLVEADFHADAFVPAADTRIECSKENR